MTLKLPTELTISEVAELRTSLLAALAGDEPVLLDGHGVESVDLAGLQVLCAAFRQAQRQQKTLAFAPGQRSAVLTETSEKAGFRRASACPSDCLCGEQAHG